jgi:hypothetical protein
MDEAKISQGPNGLYLENFYTPLEEARKELWKRWKDQSLRKEVDKLFKGSIPEFLREVPKAVLLAYIATPDLYLARFLELTKKNELEAICLECPEDKFYPGNLDKYYLGKLLFYHGKGKYHGIKTSNLRIINFNKSNGKRLIEIKTIWEENLYNFHHRLFAYANNNYKVSIINWGDWLIKNIHHYYYYYLFICNGICFDNFLVNGHERDFIENTILPFLIKFINSLV